MKLGFEREQSRINSLVEDVVTILRRAREILDEVPEDLKYRINAAISLLKPIALIKTRSLDKDYPDILKSLDKSYYKLIFDIKQKAKEYGVREKIKELIKYMEDEKKRMLVAIAVG